MLADKYKDRPKIYSEPGSQIAPIYSKVADKNGVISLKVTGEKNIYDEIQSHAESVNIETIMQRYQVEGDPAILNQKQGVYMDITEVPTTFAEVQGIIIAESNRFNQLPLEIRKEFNYSVEEYIASIGTDRFDKFMNSQKEEPIKEEPIKKEEKVDE